MEYFFPFSNLSEDYKVDTFFLAVVFKIEPKKNAKTVMVTVITL